MISNAVSDGLTPDPSGDRGTGILEVDLDAVAANYERLRAELGGVPCGACVKADAYGLGMEPVARTLWAAGCREFFVAYLDGGIRLRQILPDAAIHVFSGLGGGPADEYTAHRLVPVLNSLGDIDAWRRHVERIGDNTPADIHIDTGMSRLGLPQDEVERLRQAPDRVEGLNIDIVMSHLAWAENIDSDMSNRQLAEFNAVRHLAGAKRASLANSSGVFLGPKFHFDLGRPGAAIYGINPTPYTDCPIRQVITVKGKILQVRSVDTPRSVGYGAMFTAEQPTRIATVGAGYADGYFRSLSGRATARVCNVEVPVVGRVSMDMITLDVSAIPEDAVRPGDYAVLIGDGYDINDIAKDADSIGYEVLTSLGKRYRRTYLGGASPR